MVLGDTPFLFVVEAILPDSLRRPETADIATSKLALLDLSYNGSFEVDALGRLALIRVVVFELALETIHALFQFGQSLADGIGGWVLDLRSVPEDPADVFGSIGEPLVVRFAIQLLPFVLIQSDGLRFHIAIQASRC